MRLIADKDKLVKHIYAAGGSKIYKVFFGSRKVWQLCRVKFVDWDGSQLDYQEVLHGYPATSPSAPSRTGYEFTGWDKSYSSVTDDTVISAQYRAAGPVQLRVDVYASPPYDNLVGITDSDGNIYNTDSSISVHTNNFTLAGGLATLSVSAPGVIIFTPNADESLYNPYTRKHTDFDSGS